MLSDMCNSPFFFLLQSIPCCRFFASSLILTLLHIPYIFQIALQAFSHRALMDQILHNKNQSTNIAFWSWRSCCSLLTMLGQDFICRSKHWLNAYCIPRSPLSSGLTIPTPSANMTASSSQFIYMQNKKITFLFKLITKYLLLLRSG